jgi:hypothetical protein
MRVPGVVRAATARRGVRVSGRFGLSRVACPPFEGKLNYYSDKCYVMYACLCYLARWPPGVGSHRRAPRGLSQHARFGSALWCSMLYEC